MSARGDDALFRDLGPAWRWDEGKVLVPGGGVRTACVERTDSGTACDLEAEGNVL